MVESILSTHELIGLISRTSPTRQTDRGDEEKGREEKRSKQGRGEREKRKFSLLPLDAATCATESIKPQRHV